MLYLSPTVEGSLHDKALSDEAELEFGPRCGLLLDLGFVGYRPVVTAVHLPEKKRPKGQLSEEQKAYKKLLASIRMSVEYVMAEVKRLRIVKNKIFLKTSQVRDQVMYIASGLHNLRLVRRKL